MRKNRKIVAILTTLVMLVALLVPLVGPAAAATTYSMSNVQKLSAGYSGSIGTLTIRMDSGTALATTGKYVYLDLPTSPNGYEIFPGTSVGSTITNFQSTNYFDTTKGATVTITKTSLTQFKITATMTTTNASPGDDSLISIPLSIKVPSGVSGGDTKLAASAPSSSTFSSGDITIARVGIKSVTLAGESLPVLSSSGGAISVIQIREDTNGSLLNTGSTEALKFRLPPGFKWKASQTTLDFMWGDQSLISHMTLNTENDDRDLLVNVGPKNNDGWNGTSGATYIKAHLYITVDESTARTGDVKVTVSGATSATPSEAVVARYGEYGVTVKDYSTPDIIAGKAAQDIGKLEIDEDIPDSLIIGRTITLTLPDNAKWSQFPTIDTDLSTNYGGIGFSWVVVGSDSKMIKGTITGTSTSNQTDPAKIVLKNMQVTPAVDFGSGDLKVDVAGSQGVTGSATLAKVKAPITMTASAKPDVKIGLANQQVGDITITEQLAEAIKSTKTYSSIDTNLLVNSTTVTGNAGLLILKAPAGVIFGGTPTVSVESGDLVIDNTATKIDTTDAHEGLLLIKIKSSSTTPSTIKISNIKVTVDRTVPEGPLAIKISGTDAKPNTAIDETLDISGVDSIFPGHKDVASVDLATCITPAPGEVKPGAVVFTIGDTKYKVGDKEETMDVAPYVKNNRTYLPVRYVGYALGVTPSNILWDNSNGTVTLIKGDRVIQVKIKSKVMLINGASITMDVAPEIKDGRTMLPFRWIAQALGASVKWDDATKTVTMEI
ncbi:MAG: copper amine oxidase N-terminal domain-containing protein [Peptococcaceae bacterium]